MARPWQAHVRSFQIPRWLLMPMMILKQWKCSMVATWMLQTQTFSQTLAAMEAAQWQVKQQQEGTLQPLSWSQPAHRHRNSALTVFKTLLLRWRPGQPHSV